MRGKPKPRPTARALSRVGASLVSQHRIVATRRWLRVSPVPGFRTHAADPVDSPVAAPAVEEQPPELSLKFALRLQEFHPQALRLSSEP
jgi:hypothetical protein